MSHVRALFQVPFCRWAKLMQFFSPVYKQVHEHKLEDKWFKLKLYWYKLASYACQGLGMSLKKKNTRFFNIWSLFTYYFLHLMDYLSFVYPLKNMDNGLFVRLNILSLLLFIRFKRLDLILSLSLSIYIYIYIFLSHSRDSAFCFLDLFVSLVSVACQWALGQMTLHLLLVAR